MHILRRNLKFWRASIRDTECHSIAKFKFKIIINMNINKFKIMYHIISFAWFIYLVSSNVSIYFLIFLFSGYSNFEVKQTCQRCELDISKKDGLYNLIVQNVRLGEDEYYECQVSPGKASVNSLPLRAPVHLTIQGMNYRSFFNLNRRGMLIAQI